MTPDTIPQSVLFPDLFDKPLVATFNQEHASSDGGAVLLKAAERVYGLVKAFARCLADKRAPGKIRHTLADLIGQRVFGIACGHPDGNDADHLADDPIHKLLLGRARRITLDLDPTDDLTHGAQQLTFFNGHYGGWCYLPMLGFLSFDREAEQYLCAAVLRPGKAVAADGTLGLLCRLLPLLRAAFPRARFLVRLDGGFATPEIFDFPAGRSVVRGQHDRPRRGLLQRDGPRPGPDRPVHPQGDEAIAARPAPPGRRVAEAGGARAGAGAGGQGSPASPGRAMR